MTDTRNRSILLSQEGEHASVSHAMGRRSRYYRLAEILFTDFQGQIHVGFWSKVKGDGAPASVLMTYADARTLGEALIAAAQGETPAAPSSPSECPACGSDVLSDLSYSTTQGPEGDQVWQRGECERCGAAWHEVYKFAEVEIVDEGTQDDDARRDD